MILFKRLLIVVFLLLANHLHSQEFVDVSPFSGSALINIPLWTVQDGRLSHPVSISYIGNGIPVQAPSGRLGIGWQLNAGGSITRKVRGLPDDHVGSDESARTGWLINSTHLAVGNLSLTADDNYADCSDEFSDFNTLSQFGTYGSPGLQDTEPDIFHISYPGVSASFLFDNNGEIQFIGHNNYKIEYTQDENQSITSFTLIDDQGTRYYFDKPIRAYIGLEFEETPAHYLFKDDYFRYKHNLMYNEHWYISRVVSAYGEEINFNYSDPVDAPSWFYLDFIPFPTEKEKRHFYSYYSPEDTYKRVEQFEVSTTHLPTIMLKSISTSNYEIEFANGKYIIPYGEYEYKENLLDWVYIHDISKAGKTVLKKFVFRYSFITSNEKPDEGSHIYLNSVSEASELREFPYHFSYYGVDLQNETAEFTNRETPHKDIYGYYTTMEDSTLLPRIFIYPELSGVNTLRYNPIPGYQGKVINIKGKHGKPNIAQLQQGSLQKINKPSGGTTSIFYEPNEYYDGLAGMNVYGGGIRVKRLEFFDGLDHSIDRVKKYDYDLEDGKSSGKSLYRPEYNFFLNFHINPVSNQISYINVNSSTPEIDWKRLLIRMEEDINDEIFKGSFVGYSRTKVSVNGSGYSTYEYDIPYEYGAATPGATETGLVRSEADNFSASGCTDLNMLKGYYRFPFTAQSNPPLTQGALLRKADYSATGELKSEVINQYNYDIPSGVVKALKWDAYSSYLVYSLYSIKINTGNRLTKQITRSYENGHSITSTTDFNYKSTNHHFQTSKSTEDQYGKRITTSVKYASDYNIFHPVTDDWDNMDPETEAILRMRDKNIWGVPIETVTYLNFSGQSSVVGAQLNTYEHDDLNGNINLKSSYSLSKAKTEGLNLSTVVTNSGFSSFSFDKDHYDKLITNEVFNSRGNTLSFTTKNHVSGAALYGYGGSVQTFSISNARLDEFRFSDFEFNNKTFGVNGTVSGRHESTAYHLQAGSENGLNERLNKRDGKYIFSCWVQSDVSGNLELSLSDGATVEINTIPFKAGDWRYVNYAVNSQLKGEVSLSVQTDTELNIDDIAFYPYHAIIGHTLYGDGLKVKAETDDQGKSISYEYDDMGQLRRVRDYQNRIKKEITSATPAEVWNLKPTITYSDEIYEGNEVTFFAYPAGYTYRWSTDIYTSKPRGYEMHSSEFTGISQTFNNYYSMSFSSPGVYDVKLEVEYEGHFSYTYITVKVKEKPLEVSLFSNYPESYDLCYPPQYDHVLTAHVKEGSGDYTYSWIEVILIKGVPWSSNKYNTGSANTIKMSSTHSREYICIVKDNITGKEGKSKPLRITGYQSDPNCGLEDQN